LVLKRGARRFEETFLTTEFDEEKKGEILRKLKTIIK